MRRFNPLFGLLFIMWLTATAQEGPHIPCGDCEKLAHAPYPETGAWFNPEQPGSGLSIEIQDGYLLGYYYGYDTSGRAEWQIFSGRLSRSEQPDQQWELETVLTRLQNGACIGCDYKPPMVYGEGTPIFLEFQQRGYLRLTIGANDSQFFVPIIYGSKGFEYFPEITNFVFPEYGADFAIVVKPNTEPPEPWNWEWHFLPISKARVSGGDLKDRSLIYHTYFHTPPPGPDVLIDLIECRAAQDSSELQCVVSIGQREFIMPIANMSDSRFFGEADDGYTVEGYRVDYD